MHTILGAGGPVANALTTELLNHNETIRLVSRRESKFRGDKLSWQKADLLNYPELSAASKGSTVIYLCAGLIYDKEIWAKEWPILINNVINVAKENNARLIFFDNVYMYGLVDGPMKEDTPYNPVSVKGQVRAGIADIVMNEVKAGKLRASIARGADFYGTDTTNSVADMMVIEKFAKKETAQWVGNPDCKHNYGYIPDMGKAMYLLGQTSDSDNQIWHMPTGPAITGKEFMDIAAKTYGVKPKYMRINKFMLSLFGLFDKKTMNVVEMYYQFDHDYDLDSSKFEKAFNFKPTSYEEGIKHMSETLYKGQ